MTDRWMVFDVESNGLHGGGFAVGWVVIQDGNEESHRIAVAVPVAESIDRWVTENVLPNLPYPTHRDPGEVRYAFWAEWLKQKEQGARLAADVPWPVEANFLRSCISDVVTRTSRTQAEKEGPYPLIDIASVRLAAGFDPLATEERRPDELPVHNPLADARQSARLLLEALRYLRVRP